MSDGLIARDARFVADAIKIRYTPFVAAGGEGAYLLDESGRRFVDFGAGWAAAGLGYSNEHVKQAVAAQMDKATMAGLLSGINQPAVDLAERLVELIPGDLEKKAWFGLAGSDAAEAAQRMILRATGKPRIISFVGGWHGTTDAMMAMSAHPSLGGTLGGAHVTKVPYPNPYRDPFGGDGTDLTDRCLGYLENYLFKTICPPEQVAAVFVEAVQSDGGDIVPPDDFMPKLRALCDRHGIYLVVDEIKVGLGRTGKWFAFDHAGIEPDFVLLGKSLGGGLPLSSVVGRREVLDFQPGSALFTMAGNANSCAAGLAVLDEIERLDLVERSARNGALLLQRLTDRLMEYEVVGDVRGKGMICGVELVDDRASKEPNTSLPAKIVYRAWELGLILYYAGNWGNVLEITPPLVIDPEAIEAGVDILDRAISDALDGAVSDETVAQFAGW
ncbi:MAG: aspartate aminotransferase family protein [Thermomicrobiales bacterium]|nr:aspartate aminotransferase family protein [Thermomicrobiales bacterium]